MNKYSTNQRKILLEYLEKHHDFALSAARIAEDIAGENISVSAVYRNLAALEEEGAVRRTAKSGDRSAYYQYIGYEKCKNRIHLSCMKCVRNYHLSIKEADGLVEAVMEGEGFEVNREETVIKGLCSECRQS
ncbi:MAG: transcriptional repressor [Clostridia bacterium]|nr:transcriptional repressor [Clostridia bacterium]